MFAQFFVCGDGGPSRADHYILKFCSVSSPANTPRITLMCNSIQQIRKVAHGTQVYIANTCQPAIRVIPLCELLRRLPCSARVSACLLGPTLLRPLHNTCIIILAHGSRRPRKPSAAKLPDSARENYLPWPLTAETFASYNGLFLHRVKAGEVALSC